jgi:hypothetical protein
MQDVHVLDCLSAGIDGSNFVFVIIVIIVNIIIVILSGTTALRGP